MKLVHHVYHVELGTYVYTVKLFHNCCQLHLQDRVQTNKVFHTRLVLTVHWPLCRRVIGSLSPTHREKKIKIRRSQSKLFAATRPWGQITASLFQNLHYIKVNQLQFCAHRKVHAFIFFMLNPWCERTYSRQKSVLLASQSDTLTKGRHFSQLYQWLHQLRYSHSDPWARCCGVCHKCWMREGSRCDGVCMSGVCDAFRSELALAAAPVVLSSEL